MTLATRQPSRTTLVTTSVTLRAWVRESLRVICRFAHRLRSRFAAIVFIGGQAASLTTLIFYPLMIASIGMGASIIGSFLVKPKGDNLAKALHTGTWSAAGYHRGRRCCDSHAADVQRS